MWLYVLAIPLIAHGLANLGGVMAFALGKEAGFGDQPWLFAAGVNRRSGVGRAFGLLWLFSTLALVGAGLALVFGQAWWRPLGVVGAACSFLAIVPWWRAVPPGARFGAVFDVIVIVLLLAPALPF